MNINVFRLCFTCLFVSALLFLPNVNTRAEDNHDIIETQTILKVIGFIRGLKFDDLALNVGIIYDPESSTSRNIASIVSKEISENPNIRKGKIIPTLTSINAPLDIMQVYIIAPGTERGYNIIRKIAQSRKSVTIGMGSECARENVCALAVEKTQSIKIYLNESIFDQTTYDLDSTLRYLAVKL